MPYDNIEDIWKYLLIKADISLVSDFWFEAPQKIFYSTNLKDIESMRFCQNILSPFWASFFKNLNFFHFWWHNIWLVRRMVTMFLLTQRPRFEHIRKVHWKFSTRLWKKVSRSRMTILKISEGISWSRRTFP